MLYKTVHYFMYKLYYIIYILFPYDLLYLYVI